MRTRMRTRTRTRRGPRRSNMAVDRHQRRVVRWHVVSFCPPSGSTGGRTVAIADYELECGHVLRLRHFDVSASKVRKGTLLASEKGWPCPICARKAIYTCQWMPKNNV
jgi:hypothetical protein